MVINFSITYFICFRLIIAFLIFNDHCNAMSVPIATFGKYFISHHKNFVDSWREWIKSSHVQRSEMFITQNKVRAKYKCSLLHLFIQPDTIKSIIFKFKINFEFNFSSKESDSTVSKIIYQLSISLKNKLIRAKSKKKKNVNGKEIIQWEVEII